MKQFAIAISIFMSVIFIGCDSPSLIGKKVKKTYFTGGQVSSEFIMEDNSGQNGFLKKYGYDGKLTSTATIRNGVKTGVETGFDSQGRVLWKFQYINGKKQGIQKAYYPNGDVMVSYTYENGLKNGPAYAFNRDGSVYKKVLYKHGKIVN